MIKKNILKFFTISLTQLALTALCILLVIPLASHAITIKSCTIDESITYSDSKNQYQQNRKGDFVVSLNTSFEQELTANNPSSFQMYQTSYSQQTCNNIEFANKALDISLLTVGAIETVCLFSPEPVSKPVAVTLHVSGALLGQIKFFVQMAADDCSRNEILSEARKENQLLIENTVLNYLEQQGAQIRSVK